MSRKIVWQRCFKIPKSKLNIFLVKIGMMQSEIGYFEVSYIFESEIGVFYDVVVEEFGDNYPHHEDDITAFARKL